MKAVFKKLSLLVVTLVLVLSVSVGLTMAYFSDYTPAKGGELLVLGGQTEIEEHVTDNSKEVTIHNTGETTVLIRVGIFGPDKMDVQYDESAWEKDGNFYYYKKALKPGEATSEQLKALVENIPVDYTGSEFDIVVVQECVQLAFDDNGKVIVPESWTYKADISEEEV